MNKDTVKNSLNDACHLNKESIADLMNSKKTEKFDKTKLFDNVKTASKEKIVTGDSLIQEIKSYKEAIDVMEYIEILESPFEKMKTILQAKKKIQLAIYEYYKNDYLTQKDEPVLLDGENNLLITAHVLFYSKCEFLPAHLEFTERFLPRNILSTFCGYYLTTFQAATYLIIGKYKDYMRKMNHSTL